MAPLREKLRCGGNNIPGNSLAALVDRRAPRCRARRCRRASPSTGARSRAAGGRVLQRLAWNREAGEPDNRRARPEGARLVGCLQLLVGGVSDRLDLVDVRLGIGVEDPFALLGAEMYGHALVLGLCFGRLQSDDHHTNRIETHGVTPSRLVVVDERVAILPQGPCHGTAAKNGRFSAEKSTAVGKIFITTV